MKFLLLYPTIVYDSTIYAVIDIIGNNYQLFSSTELNAYGSDDISSKCILINNNIIKKKGYDYSAQYQPSKLIIRENNLFDGDIDSLSNSDDKSMWFFG